jgi:hypothetical protein
VVRDCEKEFRDKVRGISEARTRLMEKQMKMRAEIRGD